MSRSRLLLLIGIGLVVIILSQGVMRVRGAETASTNTPGRGRSAQAARTDPTFVSPSRYTAAALAGMRDQITTAGTTVYLGAMFVETDSVVRRWSDEDARAIHVAYLVGGVPGWTQEDQAIAREAFSDWEHVGLPVHFVEVLDTADAQMVVRWLPHFAFDRTGQTDLSWDGDGRIHHAAIQLALEDSGGRTISTDGLRAVAMHEVGHALGLPHSDQVEDLMFPTTRRPVMTDRDIATIHLLYQLSPTSLKWSAPSSSP